ncbi:MAG: glyoxylase-like metal-dependent hydrolase (beta-lactamase superfamily II) [Chlamydiales bacterium]|jgi:glyoxylase-like metal-dependent hydrolase (beta-lactamase superfamily II)
MQEPHFLFDGRPGDPLVVLRSRFWNFNAIGFYHGEHAAVVDPGIYPEEIRALEYAICTRDAPNGQSRQVSDVILTHSHHDHIRGWAHFPAARVTAPRAVAEKDESARGRILAAKTRIDETLGIDDPAFTYPKADILFDDTTLLRVGGLDVDLRFLPGHSNCTSVVHLPQLATLCTADYLVSPGLPYCRWEARAFESALGTMREWVVNEKIERIIPSHNDVLVGHETILNAIDEDARYFQDLRMFLRKEIERATDRSECARLAGAFMQKRRGKDIGARARQDLDNARRVLAEEWPEPALSNS